MRQIFLSIILLLVIGIVGFTYRAALQSPTHGTNTASSTASACQADAKVCPDGTTVGRTGASCAFAACAAPNAEFPSAGISFVVPASFRENAATPGNDSTLLAAYEKSMIASTSTIPDTITVRRFPLPKGKDANSVMLAQTMFEASGMQPKSMNEFTPVIISGRTYQMIAVERFEAQVHAEYYLPEDTDVLRFEAVQHNVQNWTDNNLKIRFLPTISSLESMLSTLQTE